MFVSVGSVSNIDDPDTTPAEKNRADVLEFNPDGSAMRVFAYGIRNCVGMAINAKTGELWCSGNERDALGDNLLPDYITACAGRRFLWLALVVHGRPPRPAARGQASLTPIQSHHSGRAASSPQCFAANDFLRRQAISRGISGRYFRRRARLVKQVHSRWI
jgi:hypothetical protein